MPVFLVFGAIVGRVTGSPADYTLDASARPHLKLILPAAAPAASASSPAAEAASPPAAEAEATPSPSSEGASSEGEGEGTGKESSPAAGKQGAKPSSGKGGSSGAKGGSPPAAAPGGSSSKLPPVKHVFVIMLSDQPYASVFGPSSHVAVSLPDPRAPGRAARALLRRGPPAARQRDRADQRSGADGGDRRQLPHLQRRSPLPRWAPTNRSRATGCVYPSSTQTLPGQLAAKHLTWRAYLEGMGEGAGADPAPPTATCGHPALGAADPTSAATPPGRADIRDLSNPFVYFQLADGRAGVRSRRRGAESALRAICDPKPHAELRLHRSRPLPRRQSHALRERSAGRAPSGRRLPEAGRPRDPSLEGLQGKRPARDHRRSGALDRRSSPTPVPAAASHSSRTCRRPPRALRPKAGGRSARCCFRRSSRRRRQPRTVQPLLAACARSRTCSGSSTSGMRGYRR